VVLRSTFFHHHQREDLINT